MEDQLKNLLEFGNLGYSDIENIYLNLKIDNSPILIIATLIALIFAFFNLINLVQKDIDKDDYSLNLGSFIRIFKEKWKYLFVILLIPVITTFTEGLFGFIADFYNSNLDQPDSNIYTALKEQLDLISKKEGKEESFMGLNLWSLFDMIDYALVLKYTPALVFVEQWVYSMALIYRFFMLAILELVGGVAVACLLNPKTEYIFVNWMKAMFICYMLIPLFLIANTLMNLVKEDLILNAGSGWVISIFAIIAGGKILLFASSKTILWRIF